MFNPDKDYGTAGYNVYGIVYAQNGKYYLRDHTEVTALGVPVRKPVKRGSK